MLSVYLCIKSVSGSVPETIDIQSSQAVQFIANSLGNNLFLIAHEYFGAIQANIFDGESDGNNLSCILRSRFTVSKNKAPFSYESRQKRNAIAPPFGNP